MRDKKLKEFLELLFYKSKNGNEEDKKAARSILSKLLPRINSKIIKRYKKLYEKYSNPIYIWWVYRFCRKKNEKVPDWIFEYFDNV